MVLFIQSWCKSRYWQFVREGSKCESWGARIEPTCPWYLHIYLTITSLGFLLYCLSFIVHLFDSFLIYTPKKIIRIINIHPIKKSVCHLFILKIFYLKIYLEKPQPKQPPKSPKTITTIGWYQWRTHNYTCKVRLFIQIVYNRFLKQSDCKILKGKNQYAQFRANMFKSLEQTV